MVETTRRGRGNGIGCVALGVLALAGSARAQATAEVSGDREEPAPFEVRVDGRVELLSAIARLAGFEEYDMAVAASPYRARLDEHLAPFREHEVVRLARALRAGPGLAYDQLALLAVHLEPLEADGSGLGERFDLVETPGRLADRLAPADARALADAARRFARDAGFAAFLAEHEPLFRETERRLAARIGGQHAAAWFDAALGAKPGLELRVIAGLLVGGHNYGVGVRFPDGTEELSPVIGAWRFDEEGVPLYDELESWVVPHEFCHSWANPWVDRHWEALAASGADLFPRVAASMREQAYADWRIVLYESLTRAWVIRYLLDVEGPEAANRRASADFAAGFAWIAPLAQRLGAFEADRGRWPTFDAFAPRVAALFDELAAEERARDAHRPRLVSLVPANGDTAVDPALDALVITFDRPMQPGGWSMLLGDAAFPELAGALAYDASGRVLTVPVKLEPDRAYAFWLNGPTGRNFASREGVALDPVVVRFRTAAPGDASGGSGPGSGR